MVGIVALGIGVAAAQSVNETYVIGVRPKTYLSIGTTSGVSMSNGTGVFVGGMTGISRVRGNHLLGVTTECLYDSNVSGVMGTLGPKLGLLIGEVDLGFAFSTGHKSSRGGYIRAGMNFGVVSVNYRILMLSEAPIHHIGMSLKFPQQLGYRPRMDY